MTIRCPQCAAVSPLVDRHVGPGGRMMRCEACGTRWLARVLEADPYERRPLQALAAADVVSEALVIEHVGSGFPRAPSPRRLVPPSVKRPARDWRPLKVVVAVLGAVFAVILLRSPIMAALPGALPEKVALLEFQSVHSETVPIGGSSTLIVEGTIINRSDSDVDLPAIRVTLRSPAGATVSSWLVEPSVTGLAPGRSIGFRSALAEPPPGATQVTLDLAAREGI
jgi:predicted Zn finger-like uncharacterized protein